MRLEPIGLFHCAEKHPYDAPRQAELGGANPGHVLLFPGHHYEQALRGLDGFERAWLLFQFHQNTHWNPLVLPPRSPRKVGVFASRAPYRPNPIGLSCVRLTGIQGLRVEVAGHDLLDGTPILDIKPYIPYADSFPGAAVGWLAEVEDRPWTVEFASPARERLDWLAARGVDRLEAFLRQQLAERPFDHKRKRVRQRDGGGWEIAYRTWRVCFAADAGEGVIEIADVYSGYSREERENGEDRYGDKGVHRAFVLEFGV